MEDRFASCACKATYHDALRIRIVMLAHAVHAANDCCLRAHTLNCVHMASDLDELILCMLMIVVSVRVYVCVCA